MSLFCRVFDQRIASFRALDTLNETEFDAGISIASPVRGFLPTRAARLVIANDPNRAITTFSPPASAAPISSNKMFTPVSAASRVTNVSAAILYTMSDFLTRRLPSSLGRTQEPFAAHDPV